MKWKMFNSMLVLFWDGKIFWGDGGVCGPGPGPWKLSAGRAQIFGPVAVPTLSKIYLSNKNSLTKIHLWLKFYSDQNLSLGIALIKIFLWPNSTSPLIKIHLWANLTSSLTKILLWPNFISEQNSSVTKIYLWAKFLSDQKSSKSKIHLCKQQKKPPYLSNQDQTDILFFHK